MVPNRPDLVERLDAEALLPAIVFIFSRVGCDAAVGQLLASGIRLTTTEDRREIAAIVERHISGLSGADLRALDHGRFAEALERGIAAHHAGMLPAYKECVEEAFVRGLIKVVFATETLALGINMPARSVVLEKLVKYNGESHADITPGEYTQLTGRAGRRGIDIEGHAVVLWQPGLDPRALAGLASRRTYPLKSSFAPTYNMAVNLVGAVGRERARTLLEQSFAQFQSDRSVVGWARTLTKNTEAVAGYWEAAVCDRGDFAEYARLRDEVSATEAALARNRKADRRAETLESLLVLQPGDVVRVPQGRSQGWVVIIDPGTRDKDGSTDPRPLVLTEDRQVRRLSLIDFPSPVRASGRMKISKKFDPREPASRRNLAAALRSKLTSIDLDPQRTDRRPTPSSRTGSASYASSCGSTRATPARTGRRTPAGRSARSGWNARSPRPNDGWRRGPTRSPTGSTGSVRCCSRSATCPATAATRSPTRAGCWPGSTANSTWSPPSASGPACSTASAIRSWPRCWPRSSSRRGAATTAFAGRGCRTAETEAAMTRLRRIWREVSLTERDARLEPGPEPDIGFSQAAFAWAAGRPLSEVLTDSGLTAGDFVRWVRQVIDFADQVGHAAGPGELRNTARRIVSSMRRRRGRFRTG